MEDDKRNISLEDCVINKKKVARICCLLSKLPPFIECKCEAEDLRIELQEMLEESE